MATSKTVKSKSQWGANAVDPPALASNEWYLVMVPAIVFIVMALLQIASFSDFRGWLEGIGFSSGATWAVILILAELWAAAGLFKIRLSALFRMVSSLFAILVSGFWLYENIRLVSSEMITNGSSGFFGSFLNQQPGWWSVLEATIFFFWTLYAVRLTKVS